MDVFDDLYLIRFYSRFLDLYISDQAIQRNSLKKINLTFIHVPFKFQNAINNIYVIRVFKGINALVLNNVEFKILILLSYPICSSQSNNFYVLMFMICI